MKISFNSPSKKLISRLVGPIKLVHGPHVVRGLPFCDPCVTQYVYYIITTNTTKPIVRLPPVRDNNNILYYDVLMYYYDKIIITVSLRP